VLPDEKILASINALIKDIKRDPFNGLGKPEPLNHALQGWWSRRISGEGRLVSRVSGKGRGAVDRGRAVQVSLLSHCESCLDSRFVGNPDGAVRFAYCAPCADTRLHFR
jgi:Txe/YoeB family toxin of toxin-antitoxin system